LRIVQQLRLENARRLLRRRLNNKSASIGEIGYLLRRSVRQYFSLMQHQHLVTTFGLIQISGAH